MTAPTIDISRKIQLKPNQPWEIAAATRIVSAQPDADVLLQMLGFAEYESAGFGKWRRTIGTEPPAHAHGKRSTWVAYKCCGECRAAYDAYQADYNERRRKRRAEMRENR